MGVYGFQKGHQWACKRTAEEWLSIFEEMREYLEDQKNEIYSIQDVFTYFRIPHDVFYSKIKGSEEIASIKNDIVAMIISRINKGALLGTYAPSPAIFRLKQLGERDEQHINTTANTKQEITVVSKEAQKAIDEMIKKFEDEKMAP